MCFRKIGFSGNKLSKPHVSVKPQVFGQCTLVLKTRIKTVGSPR